MFGTKPLTNKNFYREIDPVLRKLVLALHEKIPHTSTYVDFRVHTCGSLLQLTDDYSTAVFLNGTTRFCVDTVNRQGYRFINNDCARMLSELEHYVSQFPFARAIIHPANDFNDYFAGWRVIEFNALDIQIATIKGHSMKANTAPRFSVVDREKGYQRLLEITDAFHGMYRVIEPYCRK